MKPTHKQPHEPSLDRKPQIAPTPEQSQISALMPDQPQISASMPDQPQISASMPDQPQISASMPHQNQSLASMPDQTLRRSRRLYPTSVVVKRSFASPSAFNVSALSTTMSDQGYAVDGTSGMGPRRPLGLRHSFDNKNLSSWILLLTSVMFAVILILEIIDLFRSQRKNLSEAFSSMQHLPLQAANGKSDFDDGKRIQPPKNQTRAQLQPLTDHRKTFNSTLQQQLAPHILYTKKHEDNKYIPSQQQQSRSQVHHKSKGSEYKQQLDPPIQQTDPPIQQSPQNTSLLHHDYEPSLSYESSMETTIKTETGEISTKGLNLMYESMNFERVAVVSNICYDAAGHWTLHSDRKNEVWCTRQNRTKFIYELCDLSWTKMALTQAEAFVLDLDSVPEVDQAQFTWINEPLVLFSFQRSAENIAHFGGIVFHYHHILQNLKFFGLGEKLHKVLVHAPTENVQKLFTDKKSWHYSVLSSIMSAMLIKEKSPSAFSDSYNKMMDYWMPPKLSYDFLADYKGDSNRYFFLIDSYERLLRSNPNGVCFKKMIIPSYMKSRFFSSIPEVLQAPLSELVDVGPGKTPVPRAAFVYRNNLYKIYARSNGINLKKKILYAIRFKRRAFNRLSEEKFQKFLRRKAEDKEYIVEIPKNGGFLAQLFSFWDASLLIGIHGANLVNAIFLPSGSTMIEIFPYRFIHKMYIDGSNSGIHYDSYNLQTGTDFDGVEKFPDVEACVKYNVACKDHYRSDRILLTFGDTDEVNLGNIIDNCIKYVEG